MTFPLNLNVKGVQSILFLIQTSGTRSILDGTQLPYLLANSIYN